MPDSESLKKSLELAWAAGFFDGEGCTGIGHQKAGKGNDYLAVAISQKYPEVLHRFQAAVGLGKVYGPYVSRGATTYKYAVSHRKAKEVLEQIWPFLGERKRAQVLQAQERIEQAMQRKALKNSA